MRRAAPARRSGVLGAQIAEALAAAHLHGIVHRDIKPENLMLRPDGYVKVLDFGLARGPDGHSLSTLYNAGTLRYMSPEQTRGLTPGAPTDVFSLGLALYELAAGVHPFAAESPIQTAHRIAEHKAVPPSRHRPSIPAEFDRLVLEMLDKAPEKRPTAAVTAMRLRPLGVSPAPARTRRSRLWSAVALAGSAAVLAASIYAPRFAAKEGAALIALPLSPLTNAAGVEGQPAFSPDGELVAYSWDRGNWGGNRAICVAPAGEAPTGN